MRETNFLLFRRGPYVIAAGLDESPAQGTNVLRGRFVNLLDPELRVRTTVSIEPGTRYFLRDLDSTQGQPPMVASACKALPKPAAGKSLSWLVEGVGNTPAVMLIRAKSTPRSILLDDKPIEDFRCSKQEALLWVRFPNEARPRTLTVQLEAEAPALGRAFCPGSERRDACSTEPGGRCGWM